MPTVGYRTWLCTYQMMHIHAFILLCIHVHRTLSLRKILLLWSSSIVLVCLCIRVVLDSIETHTNTHTHSHSRKTLKFCVYVFYYITYARARAHTHTHYFLISSLTYSLRTATTNYGQRDIRIGINLMPMQNRCIHRQKRFVLEGGAVGSEAQKASSMIFWLVLISSLFVLLLLVRRPPLSEICSKCTFHVHWTSALPLSRHSLFPFSIMLQ